jgi:hypothetical protein
LDVRSAADWPEDCVGLIVSRSRCPVAIALPSVPLVVPKTWPVTMSLADDGIFSVVLVIITSV